MSPSASVTFHTGVRDPVSHALRLVHRMAAQGLGVTVIGATDQVATLDEQLWTGDPGSFLPHVRVSADDIAQASLSPRVRLAPIWLVSHDDAQALTAPAGRDVLLNLGMNVTVDSPGCSRWVEVVGADDVQRRTGQQRWKLHKAVGREPSHHAVG